MKKVKMISATLILTLATVMFGMSGDGGNVPVVPKKEVTVNVSSQDAPKGDNPGYYKHAENINDGEIVKDRLGIDTGMTSKEFANFKDIFLKKAKSLGIPWVDSKNIEQDFLKWRINLNAYNEFKALRVDLRNVGAPAGTKSHLENSLYSDVVLIGDVISIEFIENQNNYNSVSKVRISEILKGKEFVRDDFFNTVNVMSKNGKNISYSDSTPLQVGDKLVLFLNFFNGIDNHFASRPLSERFIIEDQLFSNSKNILIGNLSTEIAKMKEIINMNDSDNFYKRSYRAEE